MLTTRRPSVSISNPQLASQMWHVRVWTGMAAISR
jgi:hypothetical protein